MNERQVSQSGKPPAEDLIQRCQNIYHAVRQICFSGKCPLPDEMPFCDILDYIPAEDARKTIAAYKAVPGIIMLNMDYIAKRH